MNYVLLRNMAFLLLFGSLITLFQTNNYLLMSFWGVFAGLLSIYKPLRFFILTTLFFGIGFFLYLYVNSHWISDLNPKELHILFNRLSLILIIIPLSALSFIYKIPFMRYWKKPQWNELIGIPFIWSGFHQSKIKYFLLIALTINLFTFMPFIIHNGWTYIQEVWLLAIIFSITNASLEEIIWRGALLSRFSEQLGEKWAVIVTSLGFGLQHYSLGFSWGVCIAFSLGGLFFGGITIKSKSIVPGVIWHMSINALMVFSGFI
jgi:uncharacterized protein